MILFIESRIGGDFTMDAVWAGLVKRHGPQNVIDWPPKDKHREGIPIPTGNSEKDYGAERRSLCYTPHSLQLPKPSRQEILSWMAEGAIERIFVDERTETYVEYMKLGCSQFNIPVVAIAGHDRFWNSDPAVLFEMYGEKRVEMMFLDNWREDYKHFGRARPMSYATNFDHLWEVDRREEFLQNKLYDVCFLGYNSHPDRAELVDHLSKRYGGHHNYLFVERKPNTMDSFIRKSDYFKIMAQSRVCINLKGGAECGKALRFYEIPYVGSCMLSQRFGGRQVAPFEDLKHCLYFDTVDELDNLVETLLNSDVLRERIARSGHQHAMLNHTDEARVDYMYRCLNGSR